MSILNKLTIRHLMMNKKRTIVTIIGVILSTALMIGIGLLTSTMREYAIKEAVSYSGSHHLRIDDVSLDKFNLIKNNDKIKEYKITSGLGFSKIDEIDNEYLYTNMFDQDTLTELKLTEGRLPKNKNEVVINKGLSDLDIYKVGDEIKLNIGKRFLNGEELDFREYPYFLEGHKEELRDLKEYTFKVVGIGYHPNHETSYYGYNLYTIMDIDDATSVNIYLTFKNPRDAYKVGEHIINLSGNQVGTDKVKYNEVVLSLSGASKYDNITSTMITFITIILSLVSVACIIVIYNSFAISVMERKKQFGLFGSIGATKKQLRKTVFFEALIVGLLGIPFGILSGFIGIWTVLQIINSKLSNILEFNLTLSVYPLFIIIPIVFMVIVILISAYLPARRASKISPIETIRLNDDIKIKSKKIKTNKLVAKLFGVEGEIALKNMKRSKKKYRITIVSLFISIVLFISFSSILRYGLLGSVEVLGDIDYDAAIYEYGETSDYAFSDIYEKLSKDKQVTDSSLKTTYYFTTNLNFNNLSDEFNEIMKNLDNEINMSTLVVILDSKSYEKLKKELKLKEDQPIIINHFNRNSYSNNKRKTHTGKIFKEDKSLTLELKANTFGRVVSADQMVITDDTYEEITLKLDNFVYTDKMPFGFKEFSFSGSPVIVVTDKMIRDQISDYDSKLQVNTTAVFKLNDSKEFKKSYDNLDENIKNNTSFIDINEELKMVRNMIFVIKLLLYGFISLVTLIGVTSVFNTISTNITLRRKEFSILRSVGLTPQGFNKILRLETIIFGIKSLLYAIPVSLAITYLIHRTLNDVVVTDFLIPYTTIIISIVGVFIVVGLAMAYSTSKIKNENILDAIRDENI